MKNKLFIAITSTLLSTSVWAGCLDNQTSTKKITSVIRGLYVSKSEGNHYVILDKATCSANQGNVKLASKTKSSYYLRFDDDDTLLQSTLLTAYAKGDKVSFRIGAARSDSKYQYNEVLHIVSPYNAGSQ